MRLVLCSGSPRRRELFARLGRQFETIESGLEENVSGLEPQALVKKLALDKASLAVPRIHQGLIIGADTVIDFGGEALGKPRDADDARQILRRLRNRTHRVLTGVAVVNSCSGESQVSAVSTKVTMWDYPEIYIEDYILSGEPMDKAGAYAIQGDGEKLVRAIEGCYFNVVGLPLCELASMLSSFGVDPLASGPPCVLPGGIPCPRLTGNLCPSQ